MDLIDEQHYQLYSLRQAAAILHAHPNTVRKWTNKGDLKCYRLPTRGDRRFSQFQLAQFVVRYE